ncbi:MAG: trypsin-like peptidase domain-containing protein [Patescibacteria group bacterium]
MKKYLIFTSLTLLVIISLFIITQPLLSTIAALSTNIVVTEEEAVIRAYEETLPSVVSIVITEKIYHEDGTISKRDSGGGTGFFVSSNGYILTNKHVITDTKASFTAVTSSGKEYAASVLALDPFFDIGIVKVEGSGLKAATLGDSDKIRIGQTVLAIGNVLTELQNSVTRGIVSGIGRIITASGGGITETIEGAIQIDASVNPGNSGGPLVNLKGEVIGITTAINRAGESLGFAIPINKAKQALDLYYQHGKIIRTFLGVRYLTIDRTIAQQYGIPNIQGAYIIIKNNRGDPGVVPDSPAAKAGLLGDDIILEVNSEKLSFTKTLADFISGFNPGQTIDLKILREGTEQVVSVTLSELPG